MKGRGRRAYQLPADVRCEKNLCCEGKQKLNLLIENELEEEEEEDARQAQPEDEGRR